MYQHKTKPTLLSNITAFAIIYFIWNEGRGGGGFTFHWYFIRSFQNIEWKSYSLLVTLSYLILFSKFCTGDLSITIPPISTLFSQMMRCYLNFTCFWYFCCRQLRYQLRTYFVIFWWPILCTQKLRNDQRFIYEILFYAIGAICRSSPRHEN